jgi:hypothetical protein
MKTLSVYDPALCCSSGVCGTEVTRLWCHFPQTSWLKQQGVSVERFNLSQQPLAFAENPSVKAFLERSGAESLPLILLDGEFVLSGRYPTRQDLARWFGLNQEKAGRPGLLWRQHVMLLNPTGQEPMMNYLNSIPKFLFFTGKEASEKPRFPAQRYSSG